MLHSLSLIFITLIAGYTNIGIVKVDTTPLVDWNQKQAPLVTSKQHELYAPSVQHIPRQNDLISNLHSVQPQLEPWRPPTPPNDDVMDWTPSPAPFMPQPQKMKYKSTQPSPFVGAIPAIPKQGIFASRIKNQPEPPKAIGIPQGFFDNREALKEKEKKDKGFAQPKFFPQRDMDTGLENIFGKVFSLDEDVVEVRNQSKSTQRPTFSTSTISSPTYDTRELWLRAIAVGVLGMLTVYTITNNYLGADMDRRVIACAVTAPALNAVLGSARIGSSKNVLSLISGTVLAGLMFSFPGEQSLLSPLWNKSVIGATSFLLLQEIYSLCTLSRIEQGAEREPEPKPNNIQQVSSQPIMPLQAADNPWGLPVVKPTTFAQISTPRANRTRRDSIESVDSDSSMSSISTSSTWKTPRVDSRMRQPAFRETRNTRSSGFGMGNLGLDDFTSGNTVAGPRSRPKRGQAW